MFVLKTVPEDFIVEEMPLMDEGGEGPYAYLWMKKRDMTTQEAIQKVASVLKADKIGFSGTKDKAAVTTQLISVLGKAMSFEREQISVSPYARSDRHLSLGDLKGNRFRIIARNLDQGPKRISRFLNFFGSQRFGKDNVGIGRLLVRKEFRKAVEMMIESQGDWGKNVSAHLKSHPSDFVGAIRLIPKEISMFYVHAFQSHMWNECAREIYALAKDNISVPIIGFETELEEYPFNHILEKKMEEEKVSPRDFIIRQIPGYSFAGGERSLYVKVNDLCIEEMVDDEMNEGKNRCTISFWLEKGCYATIAVEAMLTPD